MAVREYVFDEHAVPWKEPDRPDRQNAGFLTKMLADGVDGRPWMAVTIQPEGFKNPAHFHTEAQFQVLLDGGITFPAHPLEAIAIHYSDGYTPYGPFLLGDLGCKFAVLRVRDSEQIFMSDAEGRKRRNPHGREIFGRSPKDAAWEKPLDTLPGVRRKILLGTEGEKTPQAQIWRCAPNVVLHRREAPFGEFGLLLTGGARSGNREMNPGFVRFVIGDDPPTPLHCGEEGATWLILTFDEAAAEKRTVP